MSQESQARLSIMGASVTRLQLAAILTSVSVVWAALGAFTILFDDWLKNIQSTSENFWFIKWFTDWLFEVLMLYPPNAISGVVFAYTTHLMLEFGIADHEVGECISILSAVPLSFGFSLLLYAVGRRYGSWAPLILLISIAYPTKIAVPQIASAIVFGGTFSFFNF
ncbi:MAG: hypothetical protein ACKVQK_30415 [Burkholderiales bacterium]